MDRTLQKRSCIFNQTYSNTTKRSCWLYVLMRYSNEKYVISLNWLPIIELIDFEISKLAYKAFYDESWPNYLSLNRNNFVRGLRNNDGNMIERSARESEIS